MCKSVQVEKRGYIESTREEGYIGARAPCVAKAIKTLQ